MCRWLAYTGDPILVSDLLYAPRNSLIHQSLESRLGAEATNGDGFGLGCYVRDNPEPVVYRTLDPAWNDHNLVELTRYLESECLFAHVRAAIGSPVQQTNCHPFRHGKWLFMHNGYIDAWELVHRELAVRVDPELYHSIQGTTDSEVFFHLALSHGLADDPVRALERTVEVVEDACRSVGSRDGIQMTVAASDGSTIWAARYASRGQARSLYRSNEMEAIREMYPEHERVRQLPRQGRVIVSEPLTDLPGVFEEVAQDTMIIAGRDQYTQQAFGPQARRRAA